jgi:hypothetical protein
MMLMRMETPNTQECGGIAAALLRSFENFIAVE